MYLLDTNVVSELRKAHKADRKVREWARAQPAATLYLSVVSLLEIEIGILLIERRDAAQGAVLRSWLEGQVLPAFSDRILAIDAAVARRCAAFHVPNRRSERDALIAATALVHNLSVVTRNTDDFKSMAVSVIDPWGD